MNVIDLIKRHEGYSRGPYRCPAGKWTIGYGRNLEDRGVSQEEAEYLLKNDVQQAIDNLRMQDYWSDLSEVRQAVLVDMVYNMGWNGFCGFKGMIDCLRKKDYVGAANEMVNSRWYTQVGNRSKRLVGMMQFDVWPKEKPP